MLVITKFYHYILGDLCCSVRWRLRCAQALHTVFAFVNTATSDGGRLTKQLLEDCNRAISA